MGTRSAMITGVALAVLVVISATRVGAQPADTVSIFWESRSTYQAELANEFGELYGSLRKVIGGGAMIPLQSVAAPGEKNVEQLLREHNQIFGPSFPRTADLLACELNPGICTIRDDVARWRTRPDDAVRLPNIRFEPITLHRTVKIQPGSLGQVVQELKGCEKFDDACKAVIRNLNLSSDVLARHYAGSVVVPVRGYRAEIPITPKTSTAPSDTRPVAPRAPASQRPSEQKVDAPTIRRYLPANASIILRGSAEGRGGRTDSSGTGGDPEGDRARILELIGHPAARKQSVATLTNTIVAVVDRYVFPKHCVYSSGVHVGTQVDPDPKLLGKRSAKCGDRASADPRRDHGTHLVGLIAARPDAPSGPGVDPDAYVRTVQIDPDRFYNQRYISDVAKALRETMRSELSPKVFNFSFTYPFAVEPGGRPSLDSLENFIRNDAANRLIVAAAGHGLSTPIGLSRSCGLRPACLDSRNVITVAATDLSPRPSCPSLLNDANRGAGVDLAAPGLNVVSAIVNDRLGVLTGSSQAAPLVTGALSLLLAKNDGIPLLIAKNRLIYAADQCPGLAVLGGRLNVGRALQFESAELRLRGSAEPLFGRVVQGGVVVRFTDVESSKSFNVQLRAMKRLFKTPNGYYRLLHHKEAPEDERSPLTARLVLIAQPPGPLSFTVAGKQPPQLVPFDVRDIEDYTGAIEYLN